MLSLIDVPADRLSARTAEAVARVAERRVVSRYVDPDDARRQVEEIAQREDSAFLDVVRDGEPVGTVWLGRNGEELGVYDLRLSSTDLAADLVPVLLERAGAADANLVGVGVQPGDVDHAALAAQPGFRVRATNMVLALDGEIDDPAPLALRPMSPDEFRVFMDGEVEGFAQELVTSGMSIEQARERSRTLTEELLPDGIDSPGMEFHTAAVDGETVGDLWLATGDTMAFVYNIEVLPEHRRRGYGAAIMNAAARHCRDLGRPVLGLNVFAHNPQARALYDKLGYRVTLDFSAMDVPGAG